MEFSPIPIPGLICTELLSERPSECVWKGAWKGADVVVRVGMGSDSVGVEASILASIQHPQVAGLLTTGSVVEGQSYLIRQWVEGAEWTDAIQEQSAAGGLGMFAGLCRAVQVLHDCGVAHGDLKPQNILVRAGGEVVLTDFGLAAHSTDAPHDRAIHLGVRGTSGYIAPECLLGSGPTLAADRFALGVILFELLGFSVPPAERFYGSFPAEDWFQACGVAPSALPDWARSLLVGLLERDPFQRTQSIGELVLRIETHCGLGGHRGGELSGTKVDSESGADPLNGEAQRNHWPLWTGLQGRLGQRFELGLACEAEPFFSAEYEPEWVELWSLPWRESAGEFAQAAAQTIWAHGKILRVLDLAADLEEISSELALDRWATKTAGMIAKQPHLVSANVEDPWQKRAAWLLCRAVKLEQSGRGKGASGAGLVVLHHSPNVKLDGSRNLVLPCPEIAAIEQGVQQRYPGLPKSKTRECAAKLISHSQTNPCLIGRLLGKLHAGGWAEWTPSGWSLRLDSWPQTRVGTADGSLSEALGNGFENLSVEARKLGAILQACARTMPVKVMSQVLPLNSRSIGGVLAELLATGSVRLEGVHGLQYCGLPGPMNGWGVDGAPFYLQAVEALQRAGVAVPWRLRWVAHPGGGAAPFILRDIAQMRFRGEGHRLLSSLLALRDLLRNEGIELPDSLTVELAHGWFAEGQIQSAIDLLGALEGPLPRSLELQGHIASVAGESEQAVALFDQARRTDLSLAEQAAHLYGSGDHKAVLQLGADWDRIFAGGGGLDSVESEVGSQDIADETSSLFWQHGHAAAEAEIKSFCALAMAGMGQASHADKLLQTAIEGLANGGQGKDAWKAALWLNRGHVQRRMGDWSLARKSYEQSKSSAETAGNWNDYAAALGQLAIAQRETGDARGAESSLRSALGIRMRAGDLRGADLGKGILIFLRISQGCLAEAIGLGGEVLPALRSAGRALDADRLAWSLHVAKWRCAWDAEAHQPSEPAPIVSALEFSQCLWMRGDPAQAATRLEGEWHAHSDELPDALEVEWQWWISRMRGEEMVLVPARNWGIRGRDPHSLLRRTFEEVLQEGWSAQGQLFLEELESLGQWSLCARLAISMWCRSADANKEWAADRAQHALAHCCRGLDAQQRAHYERFLLSMPDPRGAEIHAWQKREDIDMEVAQILAINERLVEQENLGTLLGAIVEAALQVTGASRGFLILEEQGVLSLDVALHSRRGGMDVQDVEWSRTIVKACLERGGALRVADAGDDSEFGTVRSVANLELRSVLCHAFQIEEGQRGVILVDEPGKAGAFNSRVENLLGLLAGQAALAIRQVRRVQLIRDMAEQLEQRVVHQESELVGARRALAEHGLTPVVGGLVGESAAMRSVHATILKIAPSDLSVLVLGESGTGKELVARALHDCSPRSKAPFVSENCAALPESLVEAELFGSMKGSFTGSDRNRIGLFERAQGGTLFLDEVGELPIEIQAKLLRAIESRKIRRLGDQEEREVDFRLVVATNRDLNALVDAGQFRADLLYRLDGVRLSLPTLSERLGDIPLLVEHFLHIEEVKGGRKRQISQAVLQRLVQRPWPGNVRELSNEMKRMCVLSDGDLVDPDLVRESAMRQSTASAQGIPIGTMEEIEKAAILSAIERCGGDKRQAAQLLGISRAKIYQRLKDWA